MLSSGNTVQYGSNLAAGSPLVCSLSQRLIKIGVLKLFCAMDPSESDETYGPLLRKMYKIKYV